MTNILILTGRFGMGHCSAAEAIRQELASTNPNTTVHIVDLIDCLFPHANKYIYGSFYFMVNKCSSVYNGLNRIAGKCGTVPMRKTISRKIQALLTQYQTDIVVSTLPICSQCISSYKEFTGTNLPLYTYITDISAQEEWISPHTDAYFVGSSRTKNSLVSKGVAADSIHICGIPVRQDFLQPVASASGNSSKTELLIMGGGLGLIPSSEKFLSELSQMDNLHLTLIAGNNQALLERIQEKFPSIEAIGYTDHVADYMRRADLLITKSGGITTFEAIHCQTPMYIIHPFLMQEIGNAEYIEQNNIGRVIWSDSVSMTHDIMALLHNEPLMCAMKENMRQIKQTLETLCPVEYFCKNEEIA